MLRSGVSHRFLSGRTAGNSRILGLYFFGHVRTKHLLHGSEGGPGDASTGGSRPASTDGCRSTGRTGTCSSGPPHGTSEQTSPTRGGKGTRPPPGRGSRLSQFRDRTTD